MTPMENVCNPQHNYTVKTNVLHEETKMGDGNNKTLTFKTTD